MFVLITTFYFENDANRRGEFLKAIRGNINNRLIIKIYILCESGEELLIDLDVKIEIVKQNHRPKFQDLIKFANGLSQSIYKIIANSDIYFDDTLAKAQTIKNHCVFCLTRWDLMESGVIEFYPNFKSQDSWIFRNTLPENIGNYFMGVPGCDNRLAAELIERNFIITNPSLSIKSLHIHNTRKRTYNKISDRVNGDFAYILPDILKGEIKSKNIKKKYFFVRRKYYSAIIENRLDGVAPEINNRMITCIFLFYYKLRLKLIC
jgi:hypothetical protein